MKVLILGYGNMGKTYANSFISSRFIKPEDIYLLVRDASNVTLENGILQSNCFEKPTQEIGNYDILILAVKPQDFENLAQSIKPFLNENQMVLSVMAGVKITKIQSELGCKKSGAFYAKYSNPNRNGNDRFHSIMGSR